MLGESPFWDLGAAFRQSLGRWTEVRVSVCIMVGTGGIQPLGICGSLPSNIFPAARPIVLRVPCPPPFLQLVGTADPAWMSLSLWAVDGARPPAQSRHCMGKHFLFTSGSLWGKSQG